MKTWKKNTITHYKKEWLFIAIAWVLVFVSDPLYMCYADMVSDRPFRWSHIFNLWRYDLTFLVLFLIHHYLLIPKLMIKKRNGAYAAAAVTCLALFTMVIIGLAPGRLLSSPTGQADPFRPLLAPPDLARLVMAILLLGVDLGAVALMNEQKLRQQLLQLEKQNLKQELEHLRYQINPHFFMNTLNNIHVLVDIDQERAKRAIVELSKLMRYSLYEGEESMAPLQHEVDFLHQYISLMKLRFNESVRIDFRCPETTDSSIMLPPLLLCTFVENAFKHGISYQQPSYVDITLTLEDDNAEIHFRCVNSRFPNHASTQDGHHGIGLANVRKRLQLQYGNNYQLTIQDDCDDCYMLDLRIPSSHQPLPANNTQPPEQ